MVRWQQQHTTKVVIALPSRVIALLCQSLFYARGAADQLTPKQDERPAPLGAFGIAPHRQPFNYSTTEKLAV